jgi:hypothetical protein
MKEVEYCKLNVRNKKRHDRLLNRVIKKPVGLPVPNRHFVERSQRYGFKALRIVKFSTKW